MISVIGLSSSISGSGLRRLTLEVPFARWGRLVR